MGVKKVSCFAFTLAAWEPGKYPDPLYTRYKGYIRRPLTASLVPKKYKNDKTNENFNVH